MSVTESLRLARRPESVPAARDFVTSTLAEAEVPPSARRDLVIAVSEACTNVVAHAEGSPELELLICLDDHEVSVVVRDSGHGFRPPAAANMPAPTESHGRGLALMMMLVDDVRVDSSDEGTVVELHHALASNRS